LRRHIEVRQRFDNIVVRICLTFETFTYNAKPKELNTNENKGKGQPGELVRFLGHFVRVFLVLEQFPRLVHHFLANGRGELGQQRVRLRGYIVGSQKT
jgi:hypothetical protein